MPQPQFSPAVATVVGGIIGGHIYSHARIDELFAEAGAPGETPEGSCVNKSVAWLKRTANDPDVDALAVLGRVLEVFMDVDPGEINAAPFGVGGSAEAKERVRNVLQQGGLEYLRGGRVIAKGATIAVRQLADVLRSRDLGGTNQEFERALNLVTSDPAGAVTAACAIVEALCKVYIEDENLEKPADQSIQPLWRIVQAHLGLDPRSVEDADIKQVLSGLSSITHGLGAFRTHVGTAHGRGRTAYRLTSRHARLVVNAAHTLVMFIIETWDARKSAPTPATEQPQKFVWQRR